MYSIASDFSFSYGHRLYRYDGKCRRPHGHNAEVRIEIAADDSGLDERGMVVDFRRFKEAVGDWIESTLDHRFFLSKDDPIASAFKAAFDADGSGGSDGKGADGGKSGLDGKGAVESVVLLDGEPTAERFASTIFDYVASLGFNVRRVDFWETKRNRATRSAE